MKKIFETFNESQINEAKDDVNRIMSMFKNMEEEEIRDLLYMMSHMFPHKRFKSDSKKVAELLLAAGEVITKDIKESKTLTESEISRDDLNFSKKTANLISRCTDKEIDSIIDLFKKNNKNTDFYMDEAMDELHMGDADCLFFRTDNGKFTISLSVAKMKNNFVAKFNNSTDEYDAFIEVDGEELTYSNIKMLVEDFVEFAETVHDIILNEL